MKNLGTVVDEQGIRHLISVIKGDNEKFYYTLDDEIIGIYEPKKMEDRILFIEKSKIKEFSGNIRNEITQIVNKQDIRKMQEIEKDYPKSKVKALEKLLELDDGERITGINIIKLNQKVNKKDIEKEKNKDVAEREQEDENSSKVQEEKTNKINPDQVMDMDDKVTYHDDLAKILKSAGKMPVMEGKTFDKMGVVKTDKIKDLTDENGNKYKSNSTAYAFVAIATDGTIVPIDFERDNQRGYDSPEKNFQVDQQGNVIKDDVFSTYNIDNSGKKFSIKNGAYGEIEVFYSPGVAHGAYGNDGDDRLEIQMETDNVWDLNRDTKLLGSPYENDMHTADRSRAEGENCVKKSKEETGKEEHEMTHDDVDGNPNTASHRHVDDIVKKLMENNEISDKFTEREVREMTEKALEKKDPEMSEKAFQKQLEEDIQRDAEFVRVKG